MTAARLSVVVCTRDRAPMLQGCLEELARHRAEGCAFEVIVVDNGSSDGTAALLEAATDVRTITEPVAGLSRARNRGLEAATGDLVAFLDDDARPEAGWAHALAAAPDRFPTATAFGGPVELEWPGVRPAWLGPPLERWYSAVDLGPDARLLEPHERPVGANFAVLRRAAARCRRVRDRARPAGDVARLRGGGRAAHPDARVRWRDRVGARGAGAPPRTRRARTGRRWLLHRAWAQGRSDEITARLAGRAATVTAELRSGARALMRGWPATRRAVRSAAVPQAAMLDDVMRRTRRLGRLAGTLSRDERTEPVGTISR